MKSAKISRSYRTAAFCGLVLISGRGFGAPPQVIRSTGQRGPVGTVEIGAVSGRWELTGKVLLQGRYKPDSATPWIERTFVAAGSVGGPYAELVSDGHAIPYYSGTVAGTLPKVSSPRIQALFNGYQPPSDFRIFTSSVEPSPTSQESQVIWVDDLTRNEPLSPTFFVVNDLETYVDGSVQFLRPSLLGVVVRTRPSAAGLEEDTFFARESGGAAQVFLNTSVFDGASGRGGSMVWLSRASQQAVIGGRSNVVQAIAASSGFQIGMAGSQYASISVLGVDSEERLLWQAATGGNGTTKLLRGGAGEWTTLLEPGMAAPPVRGLPASASTPLETVGTLGIVGGGSAVFAETVYGGDLTNRAALHLVQNDSAKLVALENELIDGTVPNVRLGRFTPGGYSWPDSSTVAFYGPVKGGAFAFLENQALLLAGESGVRLLARQDEAIPVPAGVDRIVRFNFPTLAARADGTVAFAATVEFSDGSRRDILYAVTPGTPNRYQVLLESGTEFTVETATGPTVARVGQFGTVGWRPGFSNQLLVNVDLQTGGGSAVLLIDTETEALALRAELVGEILRLTWPASLGTTLDATESLSAPIWSPSGITASLVGDEYSAEVSLAGNGRFFRVR